MFRTELPLTPHPQQLPLSARVLTIGSCFSDSIGSRLADFKVATMANPFGTVFNPLSACKLLRAAAGEDMDWQQHLVEARGRWQSYDLHAEIGADSPVELLQRIQVLTRETGVFLATADVVVLTLGTAYAYRLRETQEIISNCHKVPAEKFDKELLTADEIIAAVAETHAYLRRINPKLRFILTVSPVRHLKETLVLNSASKSMLRVACHYLSELLPDVSYFPAYELLVDDLRDYRFYASDMLHPSEVAENYIWERFTRTYFDAAFGRFKKEWEAIRQALHHKPLHAAAPEHRQFLEGTLERIRKLSGQADVRMEILHVERELAALPLPVLPAEPEEEAYEDDEERIDIGLDAQDTEQDSGSSSATLVGAGAGMLIEGTEESAEEDEVSPDSAYEQAYTATLDEEEPAAAADDVSADGDEPVRKKKRRSRGGAKRTKRKHARLAAEAAGEGITSETSSLLVETLAAAEEPAAAEAAPEVIYITEADLRQRTSHPVEIESKPETTAEATEVVSETEDSAPAAEEAVAPRRSRNRNNRRGNRPDRAERGESRKGRAALYATPEPEPTTSSSEVVPALVATPEPPTLPTPSVEAAPVADELAPVTPADNPTETSAPTEKRRAPRRAPAKPRAPRVPAEPNLPIAPDAPASATDAPAPTPTDPDAPATPAPKPRSRKRPATPAPEPAPPVAAEPPAPARKRAARPPKAEVPAPEPAPSTLVPAEGETTVPAKPVRKPRPARRKPAPDDPTTI